ncbi:MULTISPECIES: shikimate dehydrogenase [unclassified Bacillus (in: firmicutes)]|uniref:shikimate dehydrogenase n=1 Tax=unclassified Bacillus (in: firmicutes) TaxID=185979 RepID=UPI0008E3E025|nr:MULTISPECIES: shikimate dehydrogenase [unclassified Bacillus (in: firmicutes)]SFA95274.1 shikimate dehydrogenase [Bacillus sp. UNCCL13]SFQ78995.1 shikimate dehydrogenase [Bacillus sp. cl95]
MKKLLAVLGDPIEHSLSPIMHNDLLGYYKIDAHYHPLRVKKEDLPNAVKGLKAIGASGFNVTIPHKTSIMPLLDRIDELALKIGAVNTVVKEAGQFVGYNTDGPGFIRGLEQAIDSIQNRKALIVGAGGAARAIYFSLAQKGVKKIDIANRTVSKAEELISECPYSVDSIAISLEEIEGQLSDYDLIIQTTQIGMYPQTNEQPLSLKSLNKDAFVCDIIYNPFESQFLREARINGCGTQNGIEMFVFQGALAFEKWTGIFPETNRMKNIVMEQLGGTKC